MDKENESTDISAQDITFLEKELEKTDEPLTLEQLTQKLAFKKTASQMSHEVKKYDPFCKYEIDDLIYKEYDEPLTVSSKGVEHFNGAVVLKVVGKTAYKSFNCEMLEVDYLGSGTFRKHIDYMKKTNTQVLLPSNQDGKALNPDVLKKEDDPRLNELPMSEKDLAKLKKKLGTAFARSEDFFSWNDRWQLNKKLVLVSEDRIKKIKDHLAKAKKSVSAFELVQKLLDVPPEDKMFNLSVLSLDFLLEKKHKRDFICVSQEEGGKWLLKKQMDSMLENLALTAPKAKLPKLKEGQKSLTPTSQKFPLKLYLTWREIASGGIRIPTGLKREMSPTREFTLKDAEENKEYTVYYFPTQSVLLGFKEFFEKNNISQGASLTLSRKDSTHLLLNLKKSKKKLSVPTLEYDPQKDSFVLADEAFTFALPNKIIFLERESLARLLKPTKSREKQDLENLLETIFQEFGLEGDYISLHFRRAFHLVDILRSTTLSDVEKTLLNSSLFIRSEKKKGLYFYKKPVKEEEITAPEQEIPITPAASDRKAAEASSDILPEIGTVGEVTVPDIKIEEVKEKPAPPAEKAEKPPARVSRPKKPAEKAGPPPAPIKKRAVEEAKEEKAPPRKEKELKKKARKMKMEVDGRPRRRRAEKKILEEQIEMEESEMEALFAVKAKEDEEALIEEAASPVKGEEEREAEFKPIEEEKPLSGIFADKLKSALDKKKKGKKKK